MIIRKLILEIRRKQQVLLITLSILGKKLDETAKSDDDRRSSFNNKKKFKNRKRPKSFKFNKFKKS
jgi:hypothetical protein